MSAIDPAALPPAAFSPGALAQGALALGGGALKSSKKEKAPPRAGTLFSRILRGAGEEQAADSLTARIQGLPREEALELLLDDVHQCGTALKNRPFPDEITRYKKSVRAFMRYVVDNTFDVETHVNRLKQSKRVQIVIIDAKLERMAAEVLNGQLHALTLLGRVDEIKGMLVDLLK
jgi:uncharacterized protein YaaR (DUF327 family)